MSAKQAERVADRVWRVAAGFPLKMNVFLIEDGGGVTLFDAGIRPMADTIRAAAAPLGGVKRIVLGNSHADHRGAAPALGAPAFCHADEADDLAGDGGFSYFDFGRLGFPPARALVPRIMKSWDGGPVAVAGTLAEGEEVAGFSVVALPGHSPGTIGLWRERDRLVLSNDCFALFDPQTSFPGKPRIPHPAFNWSTERARGSLAKLAAMKPATAWPGHFGPLTGDVAGQLQRALAR